MVNALDKAKSWIKSKSIWGSIVSAVSTVGAAVAVAKAVPPELLTTIVGGAGAALIGDVISIWGRIVAKVKIE